jgi:molybdopterin-guanine dinucleotide biosynthesis protein A
VVVEVAGIVLAGGMSRRLGRNKAVEPLGGEPLVDRVIGRLANVAGEIVVVVNDERRAAELRLPPEVKVVQDAYPDCGSLGGIFTGLRDADTGWVLVVACDMPFLNVKLLQHLIGSAGGFDAVVPTLEGRPEPTHALYSKACLPHIERRLKDNDLKIDRFFDDVRVNLVPEDEVRRLDPELLSFFNVNTQADLDRALALAAQGN